MKVLFVINAPITGGAERQTFDLGAQLAEFGWSVGVFAIGGGPLRPPRSLTLFQPARPTGLMLRVQEFATTLAAERADVLISVNERPIAVTAIGRRIARMPTPLSAIMHTTVLHSPRQRLLRKIYNPMFNRADSVTFVSRLQRDYWLARGLAPRSSQVILNGVDLEHFRPDAARAHRDVMRRRFGYAENELVLGLSAVMRPEKNHLQVLDVVATLRRDGLPVKALFVGDGVMRPAIERRISELGLANVVTITGMVDDVLPCLAALDVGVNCSVAIETLSLSALEMMATGTPMVMSELGGAAEIVDEANGRLFPVGNSAAFAQAILSLRDLDVRRKAADAARRVAEAKFDRRRMAREYHGHLLSLATTRRMVSPVFVE